MRIVEGGRPLSDDSKDIAPVDEFGMIEVRADYLFEYLQVALRHRHDRRSHAGKEMIDRRGWDPRRFCNVVQTEVTRATLTYQAIGGVDQPVEAQLPLHPLWRARYGRIRGNLLGDLGLLRRSHLGLLWRSW